MYYLCFQVLRPYSGQRLIFHMMKVHMMTSMSMCLLCKKMMGYTSFPLHMYTQVLQMNSLLIDSCSLLLQHRMVDLEVFEQLKGLADAKGLITHSFLHFMLLILFIKKLCLLNKQGSVNPSSMLRKLVEKYPYSMLLKHHLRREVMIIKALDSTF